jgi:preprotein translocase subunit SecE
MTTDEECRMANRTTSKSTGSGGRVGRLQNLVRDTTTEIKKVTWPDAQTTRNLTLLVIVMAALLGAVLGGIDAIFVRLWEAIPN